MPIKDYKVPANGAGDLAKNFVSVVCHDLKSPLSTVAMSADLVMSELKENRLTETVIQCTEMIQRTVASMFNLIDELLDADLIESGHLRIRAEPLDIVQPIREAISQLEPLYRKKGVEIECRLPNEPVLVTHDRNRFHQVISNLLTNSLKFTVKGSVTVELRHTDHEAELVVKDTGIGIPKTDVETVFERYEKSNSQLDGHGLGLYIAKLIVDAHEGKIWAETNVDSGSEFHVMLPKQPWETPTHEASV